MSEINHFAVTRIGLGVYSEARLRKVLTLFEAVTMPSLVNQSSQAFASLIVIDAHMPAQARERIEALIIGRPNFFLIPIDVTRLVHVHTGCFDWVWDHCQDFILARELLNDPRDYVITSILDADDAWHRDVVSTINRISTQRLSQLRSEEKERTTWTRHSSGLAITFPRGYQWYIAANKLATLNMEFHSMAVFVTARFSSGVSACSSRHSQWPEFSKVVQFHKGAEAVDRHMWIYSRHNEGVVPWSAQSGMQIDARLESDLVVNFGIDMDKVRQWCADHPDTAHSMYAGQRTTAEQYDLIFRIAGLNRKLRGLHQRQDLGATPSSSAEDARDQCQAERERLVEKLQK